MTNFCSFFFTLNVRASPEKTFVVYVGGGDWGGDSSCSFIMVSSLSFNTALNAELCSDAAGENFCPDVLFDNEGPCRGDFSACWANIVAWRFIPSKGLYGSFLESTACAFSHSSWRARSKAFTLITSCNEKVNVHCCGLTSKMKNRKTKIQKATTRVPGHFGMED